MSALRIAGVLLAAGASSRMRGADKLLESVEGEPLLRRMARAALEGGVSELVAVSGARAAERSAALAGLSVRIVHNPDWASGMGGSIAAGIRALGDGPEAAAILLADMPELRAQAIRDLLRQFPEDLQAILRPQTPDGRVGNPVIFGRAHFPALSVLDGDSGARSVLAANAAHLRHVSCTDPGIALDLDTPEAWQAWRIANRY